MTHVDPTPTTDDPAVPPQVRTVAYFTALIVSGLVLLVVGIGAVYWPDEAARLAAAGGVVTSVVALIAGGLGVTYRPTR